MSYVDFALLAHSFPSEYSDGLAQGCSNSSALAMELLQPCAKPSIWWMDKTKPTKRQNTFQSSILHQFDSHNIMQYKLDN